MHADYRRTVRWRRNKYAITQLAATVDFLDELMKLVKCDAESCCGSLYLFWIGGDAGIGQQLVRHQCRPASQHWRSFVIVSALSIISHVIVPNIQLPPIQSL